MGGWKGHKFGSYYNDISMEESELLGEPVIKKSSVIMGKMGKHRLPFVA
jgi:hypothetical protein